MPHVIVKLWPGNPEEVKNLLANKIVEAVVEAMAIPAASVSVAIEEVSRENWTREVYKPDILDKTENIYIKPGYIPIELENKEE